RHDNYYVYKNAYLHAAENKLLYGSYHDGLDKNNYGPFFSLFFAPFALMPDALGEFIYVSLGVLLLLCGIYFLPLMEWQRNVMLLICLNELLTSGFNVQFNIYVAAVIPLSYILIIRGKELWAPLPFLVGAFVKLYGIVALAFFFFVKNKPKFILGCAIWAVVLFLAPMIITSPEYIVNMYAEWFNALVIKSSQNISSKTTFQDISIMGFFRRTFADPTIPSVPFLIGGIILFGLPYLRISQYKNNAFQLLLLASTMMFPVLFSSSSEGSTYIIAFVGIALWFVIQPQPYRWYHWALLAGVILFASLNSTDLYPRIVRVWFREHAFKAVPCTLVWLRIIYEMLTKDFSGYKVGEEPEKNLVTS
ncbi:MAG TPA: glycosyltransferase family 87 protein, partial [Cyclobacteriaceae bacterium]